MRIIAGSLGGRNFKAPSGNRTHPMSDKIRGAIFNALGDIEGLRVLDVFGGSGALGIEAASRGCKMALILEIDKLAYKVIEDNIKSLNISSQVKAIRANANSWSDRNYETKFDILLIDPPYDNLSEPLILKLPSRHLKNNGIAVLSYPTKQELPRFKDLETVSIKKYGDAQLVFYHKAL